MSVRISVWGAIRRVATRNSRVTRPPGPAGPPTGPSTSSSTSSALASWRVRAKFAYRAAHEGPGSIKLPSESWSAYGLW